MLKEKKEKAEDKKKKAIKTVTKKSTAKTIKVKAKTNAKSVKDNAVKKTVKVLKPVITKKVVQKAEPKKPSKIEKVKVKEVADAKTPKKRATAEVGNIKLKGKEAEILKKYQHNKGDTGSTEVQIALFSAKINSLTKHLKKHGKDSDSKRGLLIMVGKRRRLLNYLKKTNEKKYLQLIVDLKLRK